MALTEQLPVYRDVYKIDMNAKVPGMSISF